MINYFKKGITAIEILVVVAVLGIIFSVALPQFSKIKELQVVKNATSDIISSINKAQSQTLASASSSSYGVHFQSDKIIIFTGTSYSAGTFTNQSIDITSPANISNVTLAGVNASSGDIYFNRLLGTPSKNGTITVSSANYSKIVTISATGVSSSN
jgi:prepilin-type N-terminal cleavage/methylation domain-containing protein